MTLYPLFANLNGRTVLVVGGGSVAQRKVAGLLETGARVTVAAPQLTDALRQWVRNRRIRHIPGAFRSSWLDGAWLVIAATDDHTLNAQVARHAEARRIFVNVVDDAELSQFHVPARLVRGPLTLAISSGGKAPALARHLRAELEISLDVSLGALADLVAGHRDDIRTAFPDLRSRRRFYDELVDGPVGTALRQQRPQQAKHVLRQQLTVPAAPVAGSVALVGAGPGDPDLLTIKALRVLQRADVIIHDRLVDAAILERARRDALVIDVGKRSGGDHKATQQRIHHLLLEHARAGKLVVRLKGGDPMVFGRGGEELEWLHAHGIACEVVPGITAAIACAAYAGVPLTRRGRSASVHITTTRRARDLAEPDWKNLARAQQTLAIYMAVSQLDALAARLIRHGRAADTPFALIENGTRPGQRTLTGRLEQLASLARQHDIRAPALLIVGEVAAAAREQAWFGRCIHGDEALAPAA